MGVHPPIVYPDIRMELRSPRVAIVFRADEDWHDLVRLALYVANQYWGGQGFVLVPHVGGEVDPLVLRAVAAYDPDYVVRLETTVAQVEALRPGELVCRSSDGDLLEGSERADFIDRHGDAEIHDPHGDDARAAVVAACSPYRRRFDDAGWDESLLVITAAGVGRPLTRVGDIAADPSWPVLATPPDWGGAIGVAVAARCGIVELPVHGDVPALNDADQRTVARWLLDAPTFGDLPYALARHGGGGGALTSVKPSSLDTGFARTTAGLTTITNRVGRRAPALAMFGDTAVDFAVALIWDRTCGNGWWVPTSLAAATADDRLLSAAALLEDHVLRRGASGRTLHIASTSVDDEQMARITEQLHGAAETATGRRRAATTVNDGPVAFPVGETLHLAVTNQWDDPISVAVRHDEQGGATMVAAPPMPLITEDSIAGQGALCWQVEVSLPPRSLPPGRGIDPQSLIAPDENVHLTWVRNGRHGISYESHRWDFVPAGASPAGQLARPRLRQMGLLDWTRAIVDQQGRSLRLSDAGRRAETLRGLWGAREALSQAIAGPLRAVFMDFKPAGVRSDDSYPDHDGVKLGDDGYLTFKRMTTVVDSDLDAGGLRAAIDELASIGVMFRGLVIGCASCEIVRFVKVDDAAQLNTCGRCGADNQLTRQRWRHPRDEPRWFYDLHPAVRQLFEHNGDVPLLLSDHLRTKSRRQFFDTAEFEVTDSSSSVAAEADLLALSDGRVCVAEAKSIDTLGTGAERTRAVAKKLLLAETLDADEIILATTRSSWKPSTVNALAARIRERAWASARTLKLRVIAGLGTTEPTDAYHDG